MTHLNIIFVSALLHEDGRDLPAILEHAIACNPSRTLRSMVLFSTGSVMQAIDGEALQARLELKRISGSSLYLDTIVLNEEEVQGHSLSGNSLGALHLSADVVGMLPADVAFFNLSEGAVVQRVRLGIARNLLKQFAFDYS
jgi:hypothetical protein